MQLGMAWLDGSLGLACLLAGLYHVGLLLAGRSGLPHAAAHALMGIGMAAMFVPAADPVPQPVWVAAFLAVAAWFGAASIRAGSLLSDAGDHAVGAVAMLYMLLGHAHVAVATPGSVDPAHAHHAGSGAAAPPLLLSVIALGFAAWFISDVVRRLVRPAGDVPSALVPESVGAGTEGHHAQHAVRAGVAWGAAAPNAVMSAAMAIMFLGMA
jgi:hypothetical protein